MFKVGQCLLLAIVKSVFKRDTGLHSNMSSDRPTLAQVAGELFTHLWPLITFKPYLSMTRCNLGLFFLPLPKDTWAKRQRVWNSLLFLFDLIIPIRPITERISVWFYQNLITCTRSSFVQTRHRCAVYIQWWCCTAVLKSTLLIVKDMLQLKAGMLKPSSSRLQSSRGFFLFPQVEKKGKQEPTEHLVNRENPTVWYGRDGTWHEVVYQSWVYFLQQKWTDNESVNRALHSGTRPLSINHLVERDTTGLRALEDWVFSIPVLKNLCSCCGKST